MPCCALKLQVAFDDLFRVLADEDLAQVLQVGQAVEHQDALDQAIGMLHLADRLLVFVVPDALEPPVAVHARVEEILVDGGQLVLELGVQILDDLLIAFHSWGSSKVQLR